MSSFRDRLRTRTGLTLALAAMIAGSAGTTVSLTAASASSNPAAHAARHVTKKKKKHHSCIPQHNGGDRDTDNRGGPSDGDGCL